MKRVFVLMTALILAIFCCLSAAFAETEKRAARDGAEMQAEDPSMPARLPSENGTRILLHFGDAVIPGVLNDSETARALIAKLPYTQHMSRYAHDFCGVTDNLPYREEEEHSGWLNGDIDYATDTPAFTIPFEDQDQSEMDGSRVNIGVIACPLAEIAALNGSYDVLIELDPDEEKNMAEENSGMKMTIGETAVQVEWEKNESVDALRRLAKDGLTIQLSMYGGFEQVGPIGQRLPSQDVQISTSSGDIVLYSGSQIVVFYGSNSWAYTRLGKITDKTPEELKKLLGNGDVTITLAADENR